MVAVEKLWRGFNQRNAALFKKIGWFGQRYLFVSITSLLLILTLIIAVFIYRSCSNEMYRRAERNAHTIDLTLNDIYNETSLVASYISSQISSIEPNNLQQIHMILNATSGLISESQPLYSWTLFDWVNPEGELTINTKMGVLEKSIEYSYETSALSKLYPNTLQISPPAIGNPSGIWIIPAGMGVINPEGEYIGMLSMGLNVAYINSIIAKHLSDPKASFVVLTENYQVVFQSQNNQLDPKTSYYKEFLSHDSVFFESQGHLREDLHYKDIIYTHYRATKNLPYIILTGTERSVLWEEFQSRILMRLLEVFLIGCCFLYLLYRSRKTLIQKMNSSYALKEQFSHRLHLETQNFVASILGICDVLLRYYKGDIKVGVTLENKIKLITDIQQAALNLNSVTTNALNLSYVDINSVIRESVTMLSQLALLKKSKIQMSLENCLEPIYADEVRIRQIVVAILSLLLEYNPKNSVIKIKSLRRQFLKKDYLVIQIQDNGFNLTIDDIRRISQRFNQQSGEIPNSSPEFSVAETLIELHNGKYYFINNVEENNKGKRFNIIFPYDSTSSVVDGELYESQTSNVIQFEDSLRRS